MALARSESASFPVICERWNLNPGGEIHAKDEISQEASAEQIRSLDGRRIDHTGHVFDDELSQSNALEHHGSDFSRFSISADRMDNGIIWPGLKPQFPGGVGGQHDPRLPESKTISTFVFPFRETLTLGTPSGAFRINDRAIDF